MTINATITHAPTEISASGTCDVDPGITFGHARIRLRVYHRMPAEPEDTRYPAQLPACRRTVRYRPGRTAGARYLALGWCRPRASPSEPQEMAV